MRSSTRSTTRRLLTLMTSAALLLGAKGRAGEQEALPGSDLGLARAKHDARYIVVAKVGKTGDVFRAPTWGGSVLMWTELKPSATLKGEIGEEELNKLPLAIRIEGTERFPMSGEEFVFFIGGPGRSGVITKVMAKTGENLAAIAAAPEPPAEPPQPYSGGGGTGGVGGGGRNVVLGNRGGGLGGGLEGGNLVGGIGGGLGGSASPPKPEPPPAYRGTKIVPAQGVTSELLKVQNEFAAMMARDDPNPKDRKSHFAWLDRNEIIRRYDVRRIGWYGGVLGCAPRPGGGWLVKVAIRPWLYTMTFRHSYVVDTVEETYEFVGDRAHLVESNAAIAKPELQVFPCAW
jgi:hypothetical protein